MPRAQQLEIAEPVRETTQRKRLSPEKFSAQLGVSLQNVKLACKWVERAFFQARKLGSRTCFLLEDVQMTPTHAAAVSEKLPQLSIGVSFPEAFGTGFSAALSLTWGQSCAARALEERRQHS